jgi:hypothetical protein
VCVFLSVSVCVCVSGLTEEGASCVCLALVCLSVCVSVCLSGLTDEGVSALARALEINSVLEVLRVRHNKMTDDGALVGGSTAKASKTNPRRMFGTGLNSMTQQLTMSTRPRSLSRTTMRRRTRNTSSPSKRTKLSTPINSLVARPLAYYIL